jgi:MFS family permease
LTDESTLQYESAKSEPKWYAEVTRYQWLVLVIASAGWIFDAMEGQLYNLTRDAMMREILHGDVARQKFWSDAILAAFLLGGTLGGVVFGNLADRFGRKPAMAVSILFYSVFSGLTFFATNVWHVAILRFLVALGVGGEWSVAAALVAEVFPPRARARAGGIFHGSSVAGVWLATAAGLVVASDWRYAYLIGVIPALLVLWVRTRIKEPERWQHAAQAEASGAKPQQLGSFRDLFGNRMLATRAIFGVLLAAVGLATFWCVVVAGQDLAREFLMHQGVDRAVAAERAKIAYGYVQVMGMLACFLAFGPIAERIGRRATFVILHVGAAAVVPITCYLPHTYWQLLLILPVFGFFTGGMHAGYAIYFPELFPDRLRATGTGLCFNGGRFIAAPLLFLSGSIKSSMDLRLAITMLAGMYLLGAVILLFMPETKGQPLPE